MEFSKLPHVYLPLVGDRLEGLGRWEFEERALADFEGLKHDDQEAFRDMAQLLERWGRRGAKKGEPDLVEPSGRHVLRRVRDTPWLGEVKGRETTSARRKSKVGMRAQYRLYFMDIANRDGYPENQMLVVAYREKRIFGSGRNDGWKSNRAQDRDIIEAMNIGKKWCKDNGVEYRPWPSDK